MNMTRFFILSLVVPLVVVGGSAAATLDQIELNRSTLDAGTTFNQSVLGQVSLTCQAIGDPGFLLGQDPHDLSDDDLDIMSSCQTTWSTYLVAETVDQAVDPDWFDISSLTVWGLSLINADGFQNCDPAGMTFEVVFFEDDAGQPGTVICPPQSVAASNTTTGGFLNGWNVYQFDLPAVCDLGSIGRKWFTVQSELYPADCGFIWLSGTGGDGTSLQSGGDGWNLRDNDRSFCINGAPVPVEIQSLYIE